MKRHRKIAAAPQRSATKSWETITDLICDSVGRSKHISEDAIEASLKEAGGIGLLLVGGGHLDKNPLTVVAADLHLSLTTVSGDDALSLEENLNPVSGAASAEDWIVYLPTPAPLAKAVEEAAAKNAHLSTDEPPDAVPKAKRSSEAGLFNKEALAEWARSQ